MRQLLFSCRSVLTPRGVCLLLVGKIAGRTTSTRTNKCCKYSWKKETYNTNHSNPGKHASTNPFHYAKPSARWLKSLVVLRRRCFFFNNSTLKPSRWRPLVQSTTFRSMDPEIWVWGGGCFWWRVIVDTGVYNRTKPPRFRFVFLIFWHVLRVILLIIYFFQHRHIRFVVWFP